ncbi:FAD-binding domain-containing protein [Derxia lacustris]|uniref:FAD-binding domain-containing protein n=1 Tax=Derxia lacustris TaxID=764842 RepID=UPI000A170B67|nr:FAD-binding domain-containing protein [Derxia lacustris]
MKPSSRFALPFAPTDAALAERIAAVDVRGYARTRNHLGGAVTRLGPWIAHGFVDLPALRDHLAACNGLGDDDKLLWQLGWREFFADSAERLGEALFADRRPALPGVRYRPTLPADLRCGRTGVAAIDRAVAQLHRCGWLHNHARLWLASYAVHVRHVHWRAGADWLYGHLLDGDLASNHLSWQWVAGTFASKPYVFNAENVARFAPADWHSAGSVIDRSYEAMEQLARGLLPASGPGAGPAAADGPAAAADRNPTADGSAADNPDSADPPLLPAPPDALLADWLPLPCWRFTRPADLPELSAMLAAEPARPVELVHPWMLLARPGEGPALAATADALPLPGALRIGVIHLPFHARFPWSALRWRFVLARMNDICDVVLLGDLTALTPLLHDRARVVTRRSVNPGYDSALAALATQLLPVPRCFGRPAGPCDSFSKFWKQVGPQPLPARGWHAGS